MAANRDEFYARPTEAMRWWPEVPGMLAGRDVGAKGRAEGDPPGTWLGLHTELDGRQRFATVTNVRNPDDERAQARSRGALLMDFLRGPGEPPSAPGDYAQTVATASDVYNGYNLLVGDLATLWWYSNRADAPRRQLVPGFHGLSNGAFLSSLGMSAAEPESTATEPIWPKIRSGLTELRAVVDADPGATERYFAVLADRTKAPEKLLPHTGVSYAMERTLSSRFIAHSVHGTRASTVLLVGEDGSFEMTERSFGRLGRQLGSARFTGRLALPEPG